MKKIKATIAQKPVEKKGERADAPMAKRPREGWEENFREMAKNGDDCLLDPYIPTKFDEEEWEW